MTKTKVDSWTFFLLAVGFGLGSAQFGTIRISKFQNDTQVSNNSTKEFCFTYPKSLFEPPLEPQKSYKIVDATSSYVCTWGQPLPADNETLFYFWREANCSLSRYISFTKNNHAAGFFIYSHPGQTSNVTGGLDIFGAVGTEFKNYIDEWKPDLRVEFVALPLFDNITFLLTSITAYICVLIGALSAPRQGIKTTRSPELASAGMTTQTKNGQETLTMSSARNVVLSMTATMLLLYFFYKYMVYVLMALLVFVLGQATHEIFGQIIRPLNLDACLPRIRGYSLHQIILAILCTALPILLFVFRKHSNIWILQDLLGVCFCINLIQTLRVDKLKVCALLLSLVFVYDAFMVFVTPYLTSDGESIMERVVTGGKSVDKSSLLMEFPYPPPPVTQTSPNQSAIFGGDFLPMGIIIPGFLQSTACGSWQGYAILGFADILFPGLLACFANSVDVNRGDRLKPYLVVTMIAYAVALAMTFAVLIITEKAQPALFYIVPCTLGAISVAGLIRKQFLDLWRGTITSKNVDAEPLLEIN